MSDVAAPSPEADGWTRRFVVAPDRLKEVVDLYEALGHETRLEPVPLDELPDAACQGCTLALNLFRVLYTRRTS